MLCIGDSISVSGYNIGIIINKTCGDGADSRAQLGSGVWQDNLHFGPQNTIIDSPLLGALQCPKQWSVMDS